MAEAPAYTTVPGKIPGLLSKIRDVGVPPKASVSWLGSLGLKSSNDPSLLKVLRQIGFTDASGAPTPAWKEYRGGDYKAVLGRAIQVGYDSLYATYPDAHNRPSSDLGHVFSTQTTAGKQAIDKMVATFKNLAAEADFSNDVTPSAVPHAPVVVAADPKAPPTVVAHATNTPAGMTVNINVQLTLPETTDPKVYEAFFRAMREHLLPDGS